MTHYLIDENAENTLISLNQAKKHLKIEEDFSIDDDLILLYLDSCVSYLESFLGYKVLKNNCTIYSSSFLEVEEFSRELVGSILSIRYLSESGEEEIMSNEMYRLVKVDKFENKIEFLNDLPKVASSHKAVVVECTVGLEKVPKVFKQAILLMMGDFYEFRSNRMVKSNDAVSNLLSTHRKPC
ncbi:conserved protein of unknown function [Tenacibaculum sp. 190524A02b]|uniref:head-tail connector protein n=1 Tax=Tenacibaculum vairaonense TaxID=3137860 RepID=UPI0032B1003D